MDASQFDELVARLANGPSRRDALKGVAGGTLAAIGVTAVDVDSDAKGKKKRNKNRGDQRARGGKSKVSAEKKKKKCKRKPKDVVCHKGQTITISHCALKKHRKHGDTVGPCYGYGG